LILLIILVFLLLALLGTPLFVVIGAGALLAFHYAEIEPQAIIIELFRIASAPTLLTIPLFTFAGFLLSESNSPKRLVNLANQIFGWVPGGLSIVTLITCAFFTAFTGASGVTIIALGGLLFPILIKEKYQENFSLGLLTTGGSLGLLFPPSLPLILYGLVARVSIGDLFIAGIFPGLLLIIILSLYGIRHGIKYKVPRTELCLSEIIKAFKTAAWEVPLPVLIVGGIYGGIFTVTEAAAITACYVLFIEVVIYKDIKPFQDLPKIATDSMVLVGGILIILGCSMGLTNILIDEEIPMKILDSMKVFITNKYFFLLCLNVFLLIVGCLMDIFSAIIVVVPLIVPIATQFGVNPVHLGIIFLTNLEIGYSTPPVGLNLFISSLRFKKPVFQLYAASLPYIGLLLIALAIITYFPALSLFMLN